MAVSTLTDQVMVYVNAQHIDTSRVTLRTDAARTETPFVGEDGVASGIFEGVKRHSMDIECPAAPEYPSWAELTNATIQLLPKRPGCPKYSFMQCSVTSFEQGVQNDRGETVDRVSFLMLRGGRV